MEFVPYRSAAVTGDVRVAPVTGRAIGRDLDVYVWLPPSYDTSDRDYPVFYAHDGLNLFDPALAWNGQVWHVDRACAALAAEGREVVVVGIPCHPTARMEEYSPCYGPHGLAYRPALGRARGERHVEFVVDELMPQINDTLRVARDARHTGVFGSSAGGTMSLYTWARHPDLFGMVGAFSPATFVGGEELHTQFARAARSGAAARIALDVGGREMPGDDRLSDLYVANSRELLDILDTGDVRVRYEYDSESIHYETEWAFRLRQALAWLLRDDAPQDFPGA